MSRVKSALELALERSSDVIIDKKAVRQNEWIQKGKKIAGKYLSDNNSDTTPFNELIEKGAEEQKSWIRSGILETLLANIILPRFESELNRMSKIWKSLIFLVQQQKNRQSLKVMEDLIGQYKDLFKQYLSGARNIEEQLRKQWEPRLRQKEQQMSQQRGQKITLTHEQDPEFNKYMADQLAHLNEQYGQTLNQGKTEIRRLIN